MLRCADGSYYIGITNNVEQRVDQHNAGVDPSSFTFSRRPVEVVYRVEFSDVHEAISWEKHIKRWSRKKKEALMRGDEEILIRESRNGMVRVIRTIREVTQKRAHYVVVSPDEP